MISDIEPMRTLKLTVAYDGTHYAGWQRQTSRKRTAVSRKQKQRPTIQETLEKAFEQILQKPVTIIGSGRTDAGVHAAGQVAHVRIRSSMPANRLLRAVNHLLPTDIAVLKVEEAAAGFHAQFDAVQKDYRYRVFTQPVVPPFIRPYVHPVYTPLNVSLMRRELAFLRGRHDFAAFARAGHGRKSTVRKLMNLSLRRRGAELHFDVQGEGFLYTMVRSMVGTLLDIGRGRLKHGHLRRMLATQKRQLVGVTAPAKGLTLMSVTYGRRHG